MNHDKFLSIGAMLAVMALDASNVRAANAKPAAADKAQQPRNNIQTAKALVDHAKGKWIGDAEKNIAKAQAALKERQEALDKVQADCSQGELERTARTSVALDRLVAQQARGGGDAGLGNELARRDAKDAG